MKCSSIVCEKKISLKSCISIFFSPQIIFIWFLISFPIHTPLAFPVCLVLNFSYCFGNGKQNVWYFLVPLRCHVQGFICTKAEGWFVHSFPSVCFLIYCFIWTPRDFGESLHIFLPGVDCGLDDWRQELLKVGGHNYPWTWSASFALGLLTPVSLKLISLNQLPGNS